MHRMQTRTNSLVPTMNRLAPPGWQAAVRWNAMALEWMTSGWRQWMELLTVWPALQPAAQAQHVLPAPAGKRPASARRPRTRG